MDGRLDSGFPRYFQENVDLEARIRRGRTTRSSSKDILGISFEKFKELLHINHGFKLNVKEKFIKAQKS